MHLNSTSHVFSGTASWNSTDRPTTDLYASLGNCFQTVFSCLQIRWSCCILIQVCFLESKKKKKNSIDCFTICALVLKNHLCNRIKYKYIRPSTGRTKYRDTIWCRIHTYIHAHTHRHIKERLSTCGGESVVSATQL